MPFFPEVHEELTKLWMARFTARSLSSAASILTTLDGGVARGYARIPQVERAIAVHLCPRNAATWRNRPRLPSKACKLTAALAAKAYSAAGQVASALHAMAILQVYQAKALKQVHEGSTDPGLMQELRTAPLWQTSAEVRAGRHQLSQFLPVCWVTGNGREELAGVTLAAPFPLTQGYERLFSPPVQFPGR